MVILLLQITSVAHVNAQDTCSILDLKVNYPSSVSVGQTFAVAISVIVSCTINSYLQSNITASLGSLSVRSSLTDTSDTIAHTGIYVHKLTLTAVGNWSLDGSVYILESYYQVPLASSAYHYNINVAPVVPVNNQTLTTELMCQSTTTTATQTVSFTAIQTVSFTTTIWIETTNVTTVTSTVTSDTPLVSSDAIYSMAAVLTVLLLIALIGVIIGRRTD